MNTTQQGGKHLCIKKEDGLYINGAKCTDGFIEGEEYSESEFEEVFQVLVELAFLTGGKESHWYKSYQAFYFATPEHKRRRVAILLPALKEDSGEEEQKSVAFAEWIANNQFTMYNGLWNSTKIHYGPDRYTTSELYNLFLTNYTITKK